MFRTPICLAAVTAVGLAAASADAAFLEDFEDVSADGAVTTSNTDYTSANTDTGTSMTGRTDTGDLFGEGTSNIYAELIDTSTDNGNFLGAPVSGLTNVATFQFDFHDRNTAGKGAGFRISTETDNTPTDEQVQVIVQEGSFNIRSNGGNAATGSYDEDTTYTLTIFANNSGATIAGYFGGEDLENDTYDVWLTQGSGASTLVQGGNLFEDGGANVAFGNTSAFTFTSASGVDFLLDNVEVTAGIDTGRVNPIPEPASLALLGVGSLLMLGGRPGGRRQAC